MCKLLYAPSGTWDKCVWVTLVNGLYTVDLNWVYIFICTKTLKLIISLEKKPFQDILHTCARRTWKHSSEPFQGLCVRNAISEVFLICNTVYRVCYCDVTTWWWRLTALFSDISFLYFIFWTASRMVSCSAHCNKQK